MTKRSIEDSRRYEPDDGPLTDRQLEEVRALARTMLPKGESIKKESLNDEFPELCSNRTKPN